ncbi:MAG: hypothetical protein IT497_04730 [Ottowia sp.]|nr:hypothetical protein [Ottowia sp.]
MWQPFKFFYDAIREDFGYPVTLLRLINKNPNINIPITAPEQVINAHSVMQWQNFCGHPLIQTSKAGTLTGWRYCAGHYESFQQHLPEIENFCRCEIIKNWSCDIQDVVGLSASKSDLDKFTSLDRMVENNSKEMIETITEENLRKNLAHDQIRIFKENSVDYFSIYMWDGRTFLINHGGSHHFAAARYIASRIGRKVPLRGKLYTYSIDALAVHALQQKFDIYSISGSEMYMDFFEAMRNVRGTFLEYPLPRPYTHASAILLPKNAPRTARISHALKKYGVFDLGEHLTHLITLQNDHRRKLHSLSKHA